MQDDNDMGRKQDLLPPFGSDAGDGLRSAAGDYADFLGLIDRAEAEGADDWLQWADREAAKRYPKDMELVARWMLHETIRGQTAIVRTLRAVLSSLAPEDRRKPGILDALARADFLLGHCDTGAERLAELAACAPGQDVARVEAAQLRGLVAAGRGTEALALARSKVRVDNPDLVKAMTETFQAASAHAELCAHIEAAGGLVEISEAPVAASYLSALEASGRLDDCLAQGIAFLSRVPASASVVQLIRYVAIRLDRLEEVTPWLSRCAEALEGRPEAVELRALAALDADDYPAAWAHLAQLADQKGEGACRLRLGIATTDSARSSPRGGTPSSPRSPRSISLCSLPPLRGAFW